MRRQIISLFKGHSSAIGRIWIPEMDHADVAVVGCGPAGIAASIQLHRSGVEPLVFEKNRIGGLLTNAYCVENYPGFPEGIAGIDLACLMEEHLRIQSVGVIREEVSSLDITGGGFTLHTREGIFRSRVVMLATGTKPRTPDSVEIDPTIQDRVFYEVTPVMEVRNKTIVIIGAGDAAFDYALNLSRCNTVTILNRGDRIGCLPLLRDRAKASSAIQYLENTAPKNFVTANEGGLTLLCQRDGRHLRLTADYAVFAIGREPDLSLLAGRAARELEHLKREGLLHLIGDVTRGVRRQTAIAAGDGLAAAMAVCDKLKEMGR